jgi:hypothetical protein
VVTTNWKALSVGAGCWPRVPPVTWTFCSRMAAMTSPAVMPKAAIFSGSSQTRSEYCRSPKMVMSPTPPRRSSTSRTRERA